MPAVGLPSQVFTEHLLLAEVAGVLCGGTGRRNKGVWGVQPGGGQEKEVVYSLNKHLCFKRLLGASRVQASRELLFSSGRQRLSNKEVKMSHVRGGEARNKGGVSSE